VVEQQGNLTPHMKQYEDFATGELRWLPYVMFFNRPNYRSPVVNTDPGGFRISHGPRGPVSLQGNLPAGEVSLMLGASPAFGFGASSDERTITSLLAGEPDSVPWLNLAAPAFNSTQELVLFLLHRHQVPEVRDVVFFSGLNNLVVAGLPDSSADYGQFFFSGEFFRQLGAPELGQHLDQPKWALGRLAKKIGRLGGGADDGPRVPDPEERVDIAARNCARDLDRFLELAAPTGARVHYVLQPTASWTRKRYSREEEVLIAEAGAERSMMWNLFNPILEPRVHDLYAERLEAVCKERDISFLDANGVLGGDPWFFVDQVHLNDEGNRVVAEAMRTGLDLAR